MGFPLKTRETAKKAKTSSDSLKITICLQRRRKVILRKFCSAGTVLALVFFAQCRPSQILLSPIPRHLEGLEGYASLRLTGEQGSIRSKFAFLFQLPDRGRIDVSDAMGRTLTQILLSERKAYFILSSRKAYWQGTEEEIFSKFLGFQLSLEEIVNMMSGSWETGRASKKEREPERWTLDRDEKGRIRSGRRGDLAFKVEEFIGSSAVTRTLAFVHPLQKGRMKILHIAFNTQIKEDVFSTDFLRNYQQKTWEEMQALVDAH